MKRPTDTALAQVCDLASEISDAAFRADQSCYFFNPHQGCIENYQHQIDVLRDMVRRMGWMADLCCTKLGRPTGQGDAEAWMTNPVYRDRARGDA